MKIADSAKNEVKKIIIEVCNQIGAPVPVVMAIAGIESNFNPNAKSPSGTFVGIFQLSNGWNKNKLLLIFEKYIFEKIW